MGLYNVGDRIEGEHCDLYARKEVGPGCLQKHPITGEHCMRIELCRNATAQISKEIILSDDELKDWQGVHLNKGDKLIANAITVYVRQNRPVRFISHEGATHTHGGNYASTKRPTLCEIKYTHDHIRNGIQKRLIAKKDLIK